MDLLLKIDYREHAFIKLISSLTSKDTVNYHVSPLPIGDFIIYSNLKGEVNGELDKVNGELGEVNGESGEVNGELGEVNVNKTLKLEFIFERKTIQDLCASITDARFREQKARLLTSVQDPSRIVYIIEGSKKTARLSKKIIDGAILNLIFRHGYRVIFTQDIQDTLDTILLFYSKIQKNDFDTQLIQSCNPVKLIKKSSVSREDIYINQLSVIPGVSKAIGVCIKTKYENMMTLIQVLQEDSTILKDIHISDKRKLGKILSQKIASYLI